MPHVPYKPSEYAKKSLKEYPNQLRGLPSLVSKLEEAGFKVFLDWEDGDYSRVRRDTVRAACLELEMSWLIVTNPASKKREGGILVIPSNDEDWLSDYSFKPGSKFDEIMESAL